MSKFLTLVSGIEFSSRSTLLVGFLFEILYVGAPLSRLALLEGFLIEILCVGSLVSDS